MPDTKTSDVRADLLEMQGKERLHIGGQEPRANWKILDIQPGPNVDYVGDIRNLSGFTDSHFDVIYASHVLEHISYQNELIQALKDIFRILKPGGKFFASVPDLEILCHIFLHKEATKQNRFQIMRMMFGGQMDKHDFHHAGLTAEFLTDYLVATGFREIYRVPEFNIFNDSSSLRFAGILVSLNLIAYKSS